MAAVVFLLRISTLSFGYFFSYAALYAVVSSLGKEVTTLIVSARPTLGTMASAATAACKRDIHPPRGDESFFCDESYQFPPRGHLRSRRDPGRFLGGDRDRARTDVRRHGPRPARQGRRGGADRARRAGAGRARARAGGGSRRRRGCDRRAL